MWSKDNDEAMRLDWRKTRLDILKKKTLLGPSATEHAGVWMDVKL